MNIIHKRRMVSGTTMALPFESEALEIEWSGARFWFRIIKKTCEAIASRVPAAMKIKPDSITGWQNHSPFSFEPAAFRTDSRTKAFLLRGGDNAEVNF